MIIEVFQQIDEKESERLILKEIIEKVRAETRLTDALESGYFIATDIGLLHQKRVELTREQSGERADGHVAEAMLWLEFGPKQLKGE
jgi:hypothetical protein